MNASFVSSIVSYSSRYRQEVLGRYDPDWLLANWWAALIFSLAEHVFKAEAIMSLNGFIKQWSPCSHRYSLEMNRQLIMRGSAVKGG